VAGKKSKGNNTAMKTKAAPKIGAPVKLLNMSGIDKFCAFTGKKLPKNGIAWKHDDNLFINRTAAEAWERARPSD
jgi:hypothetical protein